MNAPPSEPPRERVTETDHEVPSPPTGAEELRLILGQLLDEKLAPLYGLRAVVEQLQASLDLAVHEFRRKTDAHDGELDVLRSRVQQLECELASTKERLKALENHVDNLEAIRG